MLEGTQNPNFLIRSSGVNYTPSMSEALKLIGRCEKHQRYRDWIPGRLSQFKLLFSFLPIDVSR